MKNDNRPVVDYPDFDRWKEYEKDEWEWLSDAEKAVCLSYQRQLLKTDTPSLTLIKKMNEIHEKYPDFHVGFIPADSTDSSKGKLLNFPEYQTLDFSDYLSNGTED